MKTVFQSRGTTCDVEILGGEAAFLIRFYNSGDENYAEPLHDLVIAPSSYGFLTLKKVGGDGVLRGFLDEQHFNRDIVDDIIILILFLSLTMRSTMESTDKTLPAGKEGSQAGSLGLRP